VNPVYGAHGHRFTVVTDERSLAARAERALATLRSANGTAPGSYRITRREGLLDLAFEGELIGSRASEDSVLLLLHWHVNQRVIDTAAEHRTTFHAAAARSPSGNGILLPAPMESGKTTTVTGLLCAGWSYLTDEAAAVDLDGTVWAYPKPLTIDRGSWPLFPHLEPPEVADTASSWLVTAPEAGASVVERASVCSIVFPAYRRDEATDLTPLSPSEAALRLAQSTFQFDRHGARDLRCVSTLARTIPAYELTIGALDQAIDRLQRLDEGQANAA
jgi:hypothetical protein